MNSSFLYLRVSYQFATRIEERWKQDTLTISSRTETNSSETSVHPDAHAGNTDSESKTLIMTQE